MFVFNCMPVRNIYFNADSIENLYNLHTTSCGGAPLICCPENETNVRTIMIPDSTTEKTTTIPPEPTHVLPESPNCGRTRLVSARIAKGSDAKLGTSIGWHLLASYCTEVVSRGIPVDGSTGVPTRRSGEASVALRGKFGYGEARNDCSTLRQERFVSWQHFQVVGKGVMNIFPGW